MKVFVVIEESGEYTTHETKNVYVSPNRHNAFKKAWLCTFRNWNNDYVVEEWDIADDGESTRVACKVIANNALQKENSTSALAELENSIRQSDDQLPEALDAYIFECSWR